MKKCDLHRAQDFLEADHYRLEDDEFVAHLDECGECQRYLETQAGDSSLWQSVGELLQPDEYDKSGDDACSTATVIGDRRHPVAIQDVLDHLSPTDDPHKLGRLGHYEITGVVGLGGMGVVLKAVDPSLERVVAVKVMSPGLANNEKARQRFSREAKAAAAVLHPNVVPIHGVSGDGTMPFLVMPYIRGGSLQDRLEQEGCLPLEDILRIGSQIAAGLSAAHEKGLVHRDIKPENILLEEGVERVTITDFGLARAVDDNSVTQKGAIAGTPMYMSPEQARGEEISQLSDQFSLGSVLYTLCTGRPPFRSDTTWAVMRQIMDEVPTPVCDVNPDIPEWMAGIVDRLMSKEASARFATTADVQTLLDGCLSHLQQPAAIPLPTQATLGLSRQRTSGNLRKGAWLMGISAIVIMGVMALAPFLTDDDTPNPPPAAAASTPSSPAQRLQAIVDAWHQNPDQTQPLEQQLRTLQQDVQQTARPFTEAARKNASRFVTLLWPHLQQPMPASLGVVLSELTTPGPAVRTSDALAKQGRPTEPVGWEQQAAHALALGHAGRLREALEENQKLEGKILLNLEKGRLPDLQLTFLGKQRSQRSVWKQVKLQQALLHALAGDLPQATACSQEAAVMKNPAATPDDTAEIQRTLAALGATIQLQAAHAPPQAPDLTGEWQVTYVEDSGRIAPQESLEQIKIRFTADSMVTSAMGRDSAADYQLNPAAQPAHIDLTSNGRTKPGIYDLQGDTLRICVSEATDERPTAFDSQPDSVNDLVMILKRVKPDTSASGEPAHTAILTSTLARTLLPRAASISNEDFARLSAAPRPDTISSQSLSVVLMSLPVLEEAPGFVDDLEYAFGGVPRPSELVKVMSISRSQGYVSFIQPSQITDCRCEPAPDDTNRSVGTVSFRNNVYRGTVTFQAERRDGQWVITQFHLPKRGITTELAEGGQWRRVPETETNAEGADGGEGAEGDEGEAAVSNANDRGQ